VLQCPDTEGGGREFSSNLTLDWCTDIRSMRYQAEQWQHQVACIHELWHDQCFQSACSYFRPGSSDCGLARLQKALKFQVHGLITCTSHEFSSIHEHCHSCCSSWCRTKSKHRPACNNRHTLFALQSQMSINKGYCRVR
jgi:hypothetical protein